jgi:hypothetical protein
MSKIIDIEDRLKLEQKKKLKVDKAKKLEAVRKILQCTRCLARCHKCGMQIMRLKDEGGESPLYWHNEAWQALWQTWLDYQQALKDYGESPEFIELVREVEWDR